MSYKIAIELAALQHQYETRLIDLKDKPAGNESGLLIYAAGAEAVKQSIERLRDKGFIPDGELWEAPDGERWFGVDGESIFTRVRDGYARRRTYVEQDYGHLVRVKPLPVDLD